jgi:hypothetical protein
MTLRLVEGCRFRVSVKRAADNRPIANAKIRFPWGEIDRHYDTDSNGVVMIEGVRSEQLVFQVRADGYALGEKRLEATQPGTTTDLSFSLGPGGAVEGTVHDVDGRPLFNVRVGATAKRTPAELHIGNSKTDGKGRFKIENVPTGETIELSIYQRGYVPKRQSFTLKASFFRGSVVSESRLRRKPKCVPFVAAGVSRQMQRCRATRRGIVVVSAAAVVALGRGRAARSAPGFLRLRELRGRRGRAGLAQATDR